MTLPESTSPSQNIRPFSTMYMCDPPRIYPSLSKYTPLFNKCICATLPESTPPSQNIRPFSTKIYVMCDTPRIYPSLSEYTPLFNKCICATLPESTPPSQNIRPFSTNVYVRPSQNLPPPFSPTICDPFKIYPSLSEYTPLFNKCICATLPISNSPSQNIPPFQQLCATLPESTPPS